MNVTREESPCPSICALSQLIPPSGARLTAPAAATPGKASTRRASSFKNTPRARGDWKRADGQPCREGDDGGEQQASSIERECQPVGQLAMCLDRDAKQVQAPECDQ